MAQVGPTSPGCLTCDVGGGAKERLLRVPSVQSLTAVNWESGWSPCWLSKSRPLVLKGYMPRNPRGPNLAFGEHVCPLCLPRKQAG